LVGDWAGTAIAEVLNLPLATQADRVWLNNEVLSQLQRLGLIYPCRTKHSLNCVGVCMARERLEPPPTSTWADKWAAVLIPILNEVRVELQEPQRIPRVRLPSAQTRERLGVSGLAGSGHTDIAESVPSHV